VHQNLQESHVILVFSDTESHITPLLFTKVWSDRNVAANDQAIYTIDEHLEEIKGEEGEERKGEAGEDGDEGEN
jgi:hypothetical protein